MCLLICTYVCETSLRSASLVPSLSINTGEEKKAWYQRYAHAIDVMSFIPSVTVRMMINKIFAEDDLLAKTRFEFGLDNSSITNRDQYRKPPLF